jgi:hypothetical protein
VGALLGETFRVLGSHLYLFTLLSLTVWLPGHIIRHYLEFFGSPEESGPQSLRLVLAMQVVFEPLVVSAVLCALGRIKRGLPLNYLIVLAEGMAAWGRLFVVRFLINCAVAVLVLGGLAIPPAGAPGFAAASILLVLAIVLLMLLVRFAVVDAVIVLEGANALTAWRRAAQLTAGRRWQIFLTGAVLFVVIFGCALLVGQALKVLPDLNHFVVRVLFDCVLAVAQSLFTIAFFLVYWKARAAAPEPATA